MPRRCIFCPTELGQENIDGGYYCCDNCYDNRGGADRCYVDCPKERCIIKVNKKQEMEEDKLGW